MEVTRLHQPKALTRRKIADLTSALQHSKRDQGDGEGRKHVTKGDWQGEDSGQNQAKSPKPALRPVVDQQGPSGS
jgi:hypothetical protein